ncbi:MAG: primase-helicase zinc-binding domain-containing protein, partial [Thermodesulfobacteriota bacterium]|nr:primase-helicase zinc-binding domain-containing protein [Thermodesulfobacteriota bacterium]
MMNVLDLAQAKVELKKVSNTYGGEYQGPCPGCGGEDRFHVWPQKNDGQGSYSATLNHTTCAKINQAVDSHEDQKLYPAERNLSRLALINNT